MKRTERGLITAWIESRMDPSLFEGESSGNRATVKAMVDSIVHDVMSSSYPEFELTKVLGTTDVGAGNSHATHVLIPMHIVNADFFPNLDESIPIPSESIKFHEVSSGQIFEFDFMHHKGSAIKKNEYRLANTRSYLTSRGAAKGDLLRLTRREGTIYEIRVEKAEDVAVVAPVQQETWAMSRPRRTWSGYSH